MHYPSTCWPTTFTVLKVIPKSNCKDQCFILHKRAAKSKAVSNEELSMWCWFCITSSYFKKATPFSFATNNLALNLFCVLLKANRSFYAISSPVLLEQRKGSQEDHFFDKFHTEWLGAVISLASISKQLVLEGYYLSVTTSFHHLFLLLHGYFCS